MVSNGKFVMPNSSPWYRNGVARWVSVKVARAFADGTRHRGLSSPKWDTVRGLSWLHRKLVFQPYSPPVRSTMVNMALSAGSVRPILRQLSWSIRTMSKWKIIESSRRRESVNSGAWPNATPNASPTVIASRPSSTSSYMIRRNSCSRGPLA